LKCKQKFSLFSGLSRPFLPNSSSVFYQNSNARFIVERARKNAPQYLVARFTFIAKYVQIKKRSKSLCQM
jgi:hypothetical protein